VVALARLGRSCVLVVGRWNVIAAHGLALALGLGLVVSLGLGLGLEVGAATSIAVALGTLVEAAVKCGKCPKGKHGLDFEGQPCDLCFDPTPRMLEILRALAWASRGNGHRVSMTPNHIATACGLNRGQDKNKHSRDGRAMAPAQRVIFPLTALRKRGLVVMGSRSDGLSGTAYSLTKAGSDFCTRHKL
jgi:hypothetical protein